MKLNNTVGPFSGTKQTILVFLTSTVFIYITNLKDGLENEVVNMLRDGEILWYVLATPMQFIIEHHFCTGSYKVLRHYSANTNVQIALATNIVYFYSVHSILAVATSPGFRPTHFFRRPQCSFLSFYLVSNPKF